MEISERTAKFSAVEFEVSDVYETGDEVVFQGTGSVVKTEEFDKQDGTVKKRSVVRVEIVDLKKNV